MPSLSFVAFKLVLIQLCAYQSFLRKNGGRCKVVLPEVTESQQAGRAFPNTFEGPPSLSGSRISKKFCASFAENCWKQISGLIKGTEKFKTFFHSHVSFFEVSQNFRDGTNARLMSYA